MKVGVVIQARMGSSRLPGKIMMDLEGQPVLWHDIERCRQSKADVVVVATSDLPQDDPVVDYCNSINCPVYRGSELDLLERNLGCAREHSLDVFVRITSDCPVVDPNLLDKLIDLYQSRDDLQYVSTVIPTRTYPRGYDAEVFSVSLLERWSEEIKEGPAREHITYPLLTNMADYVVDGIQHSEDLSHLRLTLDEEDDLKMLRELFKRLYPKDKFFGIEATHELYRQDPDLFKINAHVEQKKMESKQT